MKLRPRSLAGIARRATSTRFGLYDVLDPQPSRPVIPWSLLDTAKTPGGGELRLMRRGGEFSIMLAATELMNSRLSGSEQALASLSCARVRDRPAPKILIG